MRAFAIAIIVTGACAKAGTETPADGGVGDVAMPGDGDVDIDAPPGEARHEAFREGEAQIGPALLDRGQAAAQQLQGQTAADGFDFG